MQQTAFSEIVSVNTEDLQTVNYTEVLPGIDVPVAAVYREPSSRICF